MATRATVRKIVNPAAVERRTIPGPAVVVRTEPSPPVRITSPTFRSQSIREIKGLPAAGRDMGGFHSQRDTLNVIQKIPSGVR